MSGFKVCVISLSLLALGACANDTGASHAWLSSYYTQDVVRYATRDRAMLFTVHGDFGIPIKRATAEIGKNLSLPGWFEPAEFVAASPTAAPGEHRIVFVINPTEITLSGRHACAATKPLPTKQISQNIRVVAAFCAGDEVASELTASGAGGFPGDSKFRAKFLAFLNNVVSELLPARLIYVPSGN